MQMTATYAARTPRLTDAMTVTKRRTGMMSEITGRPTLEIQSLLRLSHLLIA